MRALMTIMAVTASALAIAVDHAASADAQPGPSEVVEGAARSMLQDLDANRAAYRKDPAKVSALVEKYLVPHLDIEYSARLVLGKHWRDATPEQRERFEKGFYRALIDNYGSALADFTGDRLKVLPTKIEAGADRATVRTEVTRSNGD